MSKKSRNKKPKIKKHRCDECGKILITDDELLFGLCESCETDFNSPPPDWEVNAYPDEIWG